MATTKVLIPTLLIIFTETACGRLTVFPQDSQVLAGHSTTLTCSTNILSKDIHWIYYSVGQDPSSSTSTPKTVYAFGIVTGSFRDRFQVERNGSGGVTNLVIGQVNASDAGTYLCQDNDGTGETGRARVIVLEPKPICKFNPKSYTEREGCGTDPPELELHCSVVLTGDSKPSLEWRKLGEPTAIREGTRMGNSSANSISLVLTLKASLSIYSASYICQTTTLPSSASHRTASQRTAAAAARSAAEAPPTTAAQYNCSSDGSQITCRSVTETNRDECSFNSSCKPTIQVQTSTNSSNPAKEPYDTTPFPLLPVLIALVIAIVIGALAIALIIVWQRHRIQIQTMIARAEQLAFRRPPERICYREQPIAIHTIRLVHADERQQRKIRGVAVLGPEIFVVSSRCPEIVVYDSSDFSERRRFDLPGLVDAWDIVSCPTNKCLFVMDGKDQNTAEKEIIRFDPTGDVKSFWSTRRKAGYLSVSGGDGNVVLAVYEKSVILEFSPEGQKIRKIRISSPGGEIIHPHHAWRLDTGRHFVVIHGIGDSLHRTCIVNGEAGTVVQSFGGARGSGSGQMNLPKYMAVDGSGSVMVLDQNNNRVLLLGFDLQFQRELVTAGNGLDSPCKIHLNESNGRLYVAQSDSIHIFDILQRSPVMPIL